MGGPRIPAPSRALQGLRAAESAVAARVLASDIILERRQLRLATAQEFDADAGVPLAGARSERALGPGHASDRLDLAAVRQRDLQQHAAPRLQQLAGSHECAAAREIRAGLLAGAEVGSPGPRIPVGLDRGDT